MNDKIIIMVDGLASPGHITVGTSASVTVSSDGGKTFCTPIWLQPGDQLEYSQTQEEADPVAPETLDSIRVRELMNSLLFVASDLRVQHKISLEIYNQVCILAGGFWK